MEIHGAHEILNDPVKSTKYDLYVFNGFTFKNEKQ